MIPSRQVDRLLRRGQRAAAAGDAAGSLALFDRALALAPDCAPVRIHRSLSLSRLERHAEAQAEAAGARALAPRRPAYHLFAGLVAYDAGHTMEAGEAFEEALRLAPSNRLAAAYRLLARIRAAAPAVDPSLLAELKRELPHVNPDFGARWLVVSEGALTAGFPLARTLADQLIIEDHFQPATDTPLRRRWRRRLHDLAQSSAALTPARRRALQKARQGDTLLRAGETDEALVRYAEALAHRPEWEELQDQYLDICLHLRAWEPLMTRLAAFGDIPAIEASVRQSPSAKPADDQGVLVVMLAVVRFHQGDVPAAEPLFSAAAAADPLDWLAPYFLGACRLAQGDIKEARHRFARALGVPNPDIVRRRLEEWQRCLSSP